MDVLDKLLLTADVPALHQAYADAVTTPDAVARAALARISCLDAAGPALRAIVSVNQSALDECAQLPQPTPDQLHRKPLYGLPVLVKDNINVRGLPTTGGCAALATLMPRHDATAVARLKSAGAVVIAKSSMSEFAWGSYDSQNSIVPGYTKNPYNTEFACGGSSGGTGVGVAAGYALAGLGTDTGCSVRAPAAINGLVGIRPTHGLCPMLGIMPMNADWDTVGPLARTVSDLARILDAMLANDGVYHADLEVRRDVAPAFGFLPQLAPEADSHEDVREAFALAAELMARTRAEVRSFDDVPALREPFDARAWYMRFREDIDGFLQGDDVDSPYRCFADVVASGKFHERYRANYEALIAWSHAPNAHPQRDQLLAGRAHFRQAFLGLLNAHDLDVLAFPTFRYPPVRNGTVDAAVASPDAPVGSNSYYASLTGFPALSVPMGFTPGGLPLGLQLLARPGDERRLLAAAAWFERHTKHWRPPSL